MKRSRASMLRELGHTICVVVVGTNNVGCAVNSGIELVKKAKSQKKLELFN